VTACDYSVVIPTVGRDSLGRVLDALSSGAGPPPRQVVVVDDRGDPAGSLPAAPRELPLRYSRSGGRGPAAARNVGWRQVTSPWVVFLDDDVVPQPGWRRLLARDLTGLPGLVAGSQARIEVPLPVDRRPTDWERNTAALADALWITADIAYRRDVLAEVGGFDERFRRAFREDADLGLRVAGAGYVIVRGTRQTQHPVRPVARWASLRSQAGNADDVLMRARHGTGWRATAGTERPRNGRHMATVAAAALAGASWARGRNGPALAWSAAWLGATTAFAAQRITPGPAHPAEVLEMAATSALIPPVAVAHAVRGWARLPGLLSDTGRAPLGQPRSPLALDPPRMLTPVRYRPRAGRVDPHWKAEAILFDRDGTLVPDLPGNTDPSRVTAMPGVPNALRRAREEGLALGVITNQSTIGRGTMSEAEVEAVNARVDALLGPFDTWQVCPHAPNDGCDCRKPAPGLVKAAAAALGVDPSRCAVIGDIGRDMGAAHAAGARGVLVPTRATRRDEIASAPVVAPNLPRAVDLVLAGMC